MADIDHHLAYAKAHKLVFIINDVFFGQLIAVCGEDEYIVGILHGFIWVCVAIFLDHPDVFLEDIDLLALAIESGLDDRRSNSLILVGKGLEYVVNVLIDKVS